MKLNFKIYSSVSLIAMAIAFQGVEARNSLIAEDFNGSAINRSIYGSFVEISKHTSTDPKLTSSLYDVYGSAYNFHKLEDTSSLEKAKLPQNIVDVVKPETFEDFSIIEKPQPLPKEFQQTYAGFYHHEVMKYAEIAKLCYSDYTTNLDKAKKIDEYLSRGYKVHAFGGRHVLGGLILVSPKGKVTLAYHGTEDTNDLALDGAGWFATADWCKGVTHAGFMKRHNDTWDQAYLILQQIAEKQGKELKGLKITVTGHSLGGALAQMAALRLAKLSEVKDNIRVVTFGTPRVFDYEAASEYDALLKEKSLRIHQRGVDPVTMVGPGWLGYKHVGTPHAISKAGSKFPHLMNGYTGGLASAEALEQPVLRKSNPLGYAFSSTVGTIINKTIVPVHKACASLMSKVFGKEQLIEEKQGKPVEVKQKEQATPTTNNSTLFGKIASWFGR